MEEVLDHLEEEGDGPLHLEGEGVAIKPDSDDEESLEEVLDEESKVGSNACRALHRNRIKGLWGDKGPTSLGPGLALVLQ